ncbi:MAG: SGNH/GDSL hydrolase family protein [Bacteroidales bacterium]
MLRHQDIQQDETLGATSIRYLALGDSYTIGEGVAEGTGFPQQLAGRLQNAGFLPEVTIIARTGWSANQLAEGIAENAPQGTYPLVTLLIGVNNQYRRMDATEYRRELRDLIRQCIGFAGNDTRRVIVISIPDYSVTPFAAGMDTARIAGEIDAFNAIKKSETQRTGVAFADVTPVSRQVAGDLSLLASDGLHPSARMYGKWADLLFPMSNKILR